MDFIQILCWVVWDFMGKFPQFLMELSACHTSFFSFSDNNLSIYQWVFTKLGMCIDSVEIWFGLLTGKFHEFFTVTCHHTSIFLFPDDYLTKYQSIWPNMACALIVWRSGFGLLMGKFCQFLTELSAHHTIVGGVIIVSPFSAHLGRRLQGSL